MKRNAIPKGIKKYKALLFRLNGSPIFGFFDTIEELKAELWAKSCTYADVYFYSVELSRFIYYGIVGRRS